MIDMFCCSDATRQDGAPAPGTKFGMGSVLVLLLSAHCCVDIAWCSRCRWLVGWSRGCIVANRCRLYLLLSTVFSLSQRRIMLDFVLLNFLSDSV